MANEKTNMERVFTIVSNKRKPVIPTSYSLHANITSSRCLGVNTNEHLDLACGEHSSPRATAVEQLVSDDPITQCVVEMVLHLICHKLPCLYNDNEKY